MALSYNEIRRRAIEFAHEYRDATRENAESQSFYNDFFNVFGISRRRVASFEEPVKKLGKDRGRIDLFWKGTLLAEQKTKGKDLKEAYTQALDYFPGLKEEQLPRYILGAVAGVVGIRRGAISGNMKVQFQAARSIG